MALGDGGAFGVRSRVSASLVLLLLLLGHAASAQRILPGVRPGDTLPTLPPFAPSAPPETPILPPVPMPAEGEEGDLYGAVAIPVREIRITGNTVLPEAVLADLVARYTGRRLTFGELATLRDLITLAYVERGYVTSGAELPDQRIEDGVVEIRVVEGRLAEIDVETSGRFRPSYFRARLAARQHGVLNVTRLQQQLELFQIDPRIERIEAKLEPTDQRGRSRLQVRVLEAPFYALSADFDNLRTPSIGALGGGGGVRVANAIGVGDETSLGFAASEGLGQFQAQFSLPVNVWDTRLGVRYQYSRGDVVDGDFAALGIESESETFGLILRQPLYRSLQTTLGASLEADWRRSQSFLFDGAVGLPTAYSPEGKSQVSVLRLGFDASYRSRSQSMALRSLLSVGLDALGATRSPAGVPGGEFVSWLGQVQWAGRLPGSEAQLVARFDTQLSSAPLLPLEQFAVGGFYTVRGYRENAVVRDNGLAGSLELRLPLFARRKPDVRVELAPFFDVGRSWNDDERLGAANSAPVTLASLGLGLRLAYGSWGRAEVYWGRQLKSLDILGSGDLQDDGVQFRVGVLWP